MSSELPNGIFVEDIRIIFDLSPDDTILFSHGHAKIELGRTGVNLDWFARKILQFESHDLGKVLEHNAREGRFGDFAGGVKLLQKPAERNVMVRVNLETLGADTRQEITERLLWANMAGDW